MRLTKREREVTVLVGGLNLSYAKAGRRLKITSATARYYARRVAVSAGGGSPRETLARLFLQRYDELRPLADELGGIRPPG